MAERTERMLYSEAKADLKNWHFSDPTTNSKGGKSVFIYKGPQVLVSPSIQLTNNTDPKLRIPFGVTKYDKASTSTRLNLDLSVRCTDLEEFFKELDEFLPKVAFNKCEEWFKKSLKQEEIASMYKPILTTSEQFPSMIRTKVNTKGQHVVDVWKVTQDKGGELTCVAGTVDDIERGGECFACVSVTGMYFLARLFGCTLTTTDVIVFPAAKRCMPRFAGISLKVEAETDEDGDLAERRGHDDAHVEARRVA